RRRLVVIRSRLRLLRDAPRAIVILGSRNDRHREHREANQPRHQNFFAFHCQSPLHDRRASKVPSIVVEKTSVMPWLSRLGMRESAILDARNRVAKTKKGNG